MSVLLETTHGDIVIDLFVQDCPQACLNFIKLCKIKFYNFSPIYNVQKDYTCQTGDPEYPEGDGGRSIWSCIDSKRPRVFEPEIDPKKHKHDVRGVVSLATTVTSQTDDDEPIRVAGSQFIITLGTNLETLDGKAAPFGQVVEGLETLDKINSAYCDGDGRPLKDIRIKHTYILDDPFEDPDGLEAPAESPPPTEVQLSTVRLADDAEPEEEDEEKVEERRKEQDARAQALTLEVVGDLPFAEVKPMENVLFVCKLNSVTNDEDLELIFSRFGPIVSCEIIRDKVSGESLQYAFIEYENQEDCERAYLKMEGVLVDDRRIHVDFSQSVSQLSGSWRSATNEKRAQHHGKSLPGARPRDESAGERVKDDYGRDRHRDDGRERRDDRGNRDRDQDRDRRRDRDRDSHRYRDRDSQRDSHRDSTRDSHRERDRRDDDRERSYKRDRGYDRERERRYRDDRDSRRRGDDYDHRDKRQRS